MTKSTPPTPALDALKLAYIEAGPAGAGDTPVIGYVGQDVPAELITASGAIPLRLSGNPEWPTAVADRYLGTGLDPAIRSILAGIIDNRYGALRAIAISSDCDASQRLFFVLREIQRVEPSVTLPPIHLVDILHEPRHTTSRYNRIRIDQFLLQLAQWMGDPIEAEAIAQAIHDHDGARRLQRQVLQLRRVWPARLSGADALAVLGAGTRLPVTEYCRLLESLLNQTDALPLLEAPRVYLSGSGHDTLDVYSAIESAGAVIVGEDHDRGELTVGSDVGSPDLDALALRYRDNGPTSQRASVQLRAAYAASAVTVSAADVFVSYSREKDDAPLWDFANQAAAVGIPAIAIHHQPYGRIDTAALHGAINGSNHEEMAS